MESPHGGRRDGEVLEPLTRGARQAFADLRAVDTVAQPPPQLQVVAGCVEESEERVDPRFDRSRLDPADRRLRNPGSRRERALGQAGPGLEPFLSSAPPFSMLIAYSLSQHTPGRRSPSSLAFLTAKSR